jgi:hypothetical protein
VEVVPNIHPEDEYVGQVLEVEIALGSADLENKHLMMLLNLDENSYRGHASMHVVYVLHTAASMHLNRDTHQASPSVNTTKAMHVFNL